MKGKQRKWFLKKRGALNKTFVIKRSCIISRKLKDFLKLNSRRRFLHFIASYSPYRNEVNPNLFFDSTSLYFPKVASVKDADMSFYKGVLAKSFRGIKEPKVFKRKVFKRLLDVVIVPGVGFDERGYRIGYGKGFYDRFLKSLKALKVGVAYDCCIVDKINNTKDDVPVDVVITERRKILCWLRR